MLCGSGCVGSFFCVDAQRVSCYADRAPVCQAISSSFVQILAFASDRTSDIIFAIDRSG
jgi:hypothetical protein